MAINAIFPIERKEARFCHIQVPLNYTELDSKDYLQKYSLCAYAKIPLSKDEFIDVKLKVLRKGGTKYTMKYRNHSLGITIKTDDAPGFPHIDLEEKDETQKKIRLKVIQTITKKA